MCARDEGVELRLYTRGSEMAWHTVRLASPRLTCPLPWGSFQGIGVPSLPARLTIASYLPLFHPTNSRTSCCTRCRSMSSCSRSGTRLIAGRSGATQKGGFNLRGLHLARGCWCARRAHRIAFRLCPLASAVFSRQSLLPPWSAQQSRGTLVCWPRQAGDETHNYIL
mgnify:CR=1 FL=1